MIFYFSATGNNKYIAQRIAAANRDRLFSIANCMKNGRLEFTLNKGEDIGFVTPTYFWGLPSIVVDFVKAMKLNGDGERYVYHVLSYGTTTGSAGSYLRSLLKEKNVEVNAEYAVEMVDTWTPLFDVSDKLKNQSINAAAEPKIAEIAAQIKAKQHGIFNKARVPRLISSFAQLEYKKRTTKDFSVLDSCVGCGLCEKQCPVSAIEMRDGKPVHVKTNCTLCLGCLHRCPQFAIQYGKKTASRGQYVNPNVKL